MAVTRTLRCRRSAAAAAAVVGCAALLQLINPQVAHGLLCNKDAGCSDSGCSAAGGGCSFRDGVSCKCYSSDGTFLGDPHVVGFLGHEFFFAGYDNTVFALLSEPMHQVNIQLQAPMGTNLTDLWITGTGIKYGHEFNLTLEMALDPSAPLPRVQDEDDRSVQRFVLPAPVEEVMKVAVNGEDVSDMLYSAAGSTVTYASGVTVVFHAKPAVRQFRSAFEQGNLVTVITPDMHITVAYESGAKLGAPHLDVTLKLHDMEMEGLHGVLGQTAYWPADAPAKLVGADSSYAVDGLLGTNFEFATFSGARTVASASRRVLLGMPTFAVSGSFVA